MSTGPSTVSTASRCCGLSWERKDKDGSGSRSSTLILQDAPPRPVIPSEEDRPRSGRSLQSRDLLFACDVKTAGERRFLTAEARTNAQTTAPGTPCTDTRPAKTA